MAHHCQAALVTCEDFRLHQRADGRNYVAELLRSLEVDADLICRAGGVQDLVRPRPGFDEDLLRDLAVSVQLHRAGRIYLLNHEDCGAYASLGLRSRDEELEQHRSDLRGARAILEKTFPGVAVVTLFASLRPGTTDVFEISPVE